MNKKDIAIVGMSCLFPGARDMDEYWDNLKNGVDSVTEMPEGKMSPAYFNQSDNDASAVDRFYCNKGGFLPETTFDPIEYGFLPLAAQGMDPDHMMAIKLVYKALEDAEVFEKNIPLNKAALIMGKGNYAGLSMVRVIEIIHFGEQITELLKNALPDLSKEEIDKVKKAFQKDKGRYQADTAIGVIPNLVVSNVANKLDIGGPVYTVDAACASSLIAVDHCVKELLSGRSDIAIAGGAHIGQSAPFWSVFTQIGAMSHKKKISPFSEDADGLIVGEGMGFVVLKRLETALADKDRIYSVIKGVGVSSDGAGVSVMAPSTKGQQKAIRRAWENADMDISKVGYIEAHGTATVIGDRIEIETLDSVFPKTNENDSEILFGSVKSNIGHTMPAAGIASIIKTSLSLYNRKIPPTLHCEKPLKRIQETRFRPVQELMDWDESKYPAIAGVNAFGFGGINGHVVLEAYGEKNNEKEKLSDTEKKIAFKDSVLILTAKSKNELLDMLDKQDLSMPSLDGDYRLALFNPTEERIKKAKVLISKDRPWKGRQDIWFTNEPVLKDGGKIAFLFSGFDTLSDPETDSIEEYFDTEIGNYKNIVEENPKLEHSMRLFRKNELIDKTLKNIGVKPDLTAGHSVGEWHAMFSAGMVSDDSIIRLYNSFDPDDYKLDDTYFLAVGCGVDRIAPWMEDIPDLYIANDNCTNQSLLCGVESSLDKIISVLRREQVFYQKLEFQSGFHTPFIKDKMYLFENGFNQMEFKDPIIPVWSATSLEIYPKGREEIRKLSVEHLLSMVRFRELIEKLHKQEKARVFIQIGSGSLVGFVDDTLKKAPYSGISTNIPTRTAVEQMRRVLALLFIEGRAVDYSFLGVNSKPKVKTSNLVVNIPSSLNVTTDFSVLKEIVQKHKKEAPQLPIETFSTNTNDPILKMFNENIQELHQMQSEVVEIYQKRRGAVGSINNETEQEQVNLVENIAEKPLKVNRGILEEAILVERTGTTFEEILHIDMEKYPFLMDHALVHQPKGWPILDDINPVLPMTMIFELLAEVAKKQDTTKKITKIGPITVFKWIETNHPLEKKVEGVWKTEDTVILTIKEHAICEVTLGDKYGVHSEYLNKIDLGENNIEIPNPEKIYRDHMFHGPNYQGILEISDLSRKGIRASVKHSGGKGSLLDNVGQLFGLITQLTETKDYTTFPVRIQEINMYDDFQDQSGYFECTILVTSITDTLVTSDIVIEKEGKIWSVIKGWANQRFEIDKKLWSVIIRPKNILLAEEIAPNVQYYYNAYRRVASWDFLTKRYLCAEEKQHYKKLLLNQQRNYLISRIAAKDAVRAYTIKNYGEDYYPVEIHINKNAHNKPFVDKIKEANDMHISLAHKGSFAVSVVSDKPVGIDIELIEEREEGFMELSFTANEIALIKEKGDTAEWSTRFWVAKESYGKMLGIGLAGNPRQFEVESVDGEILTIKETKIKTIKNNENLIIGWTQ